MGKLQNDKIYTNLGAVISDLDYGDFIYFIYNLGMDYYDGLDVISKADWQDILGVLKENYTRYEVENKIGYEEFINNMATFINEKFYKHKSAYDVMMDALYSFEKGNQDSRLEYLIKDFDEHEELDNEFSQSL